MPPVTFSSMDAKDRGPNILFNETKGEILRLSDGLRSLQRKLKQQYKVNTIRDDILKDSLTPSSVLVIACPTQKFTEGQFSTIRRHIESGGSLLVLAEEGGEKKANTNINFLLEEYGIAINNDSVIRTCFYRYFHPKECYITNGVLNRALLDMTGHSLHSIQHKEENLNSRNLSFVYPFGSTLNVVKPAIAVLSSGSVSFPLNRPVCAFYEHPNSGGRVAVLASGHCLADQYIDKDDNNKVKDIIFSFLTSKDFHLDQIDAEDPEVADYNMTPDFSLLSEKLCSCLQESEEVPTDFTQLFDSKLTAIDMDQVPSCIDAFKKLNVKHEPLKLITPQFDAPQPALQPAVFPPSFRELPHPPLELYDLDEAFSSEKSRLAQVTNKCKDDDVEYFIRECGEILGITPQLPPTSRDAIHILEYVIMHLSEFKKVNQEIGDMSQFD